jgi:hypothetical protein
MMKRHTSTPASEHQTTSLPAHSSPLSPLLEDLDGALIKKDLLLKSEFSWLRQASLSLFALPFWLLKGRARLKREISHRVLLDVTLSIIDS